MLSYLIDNVQRLLRRMSEELSPENMHLYLDLLNKRREWIRGEMDTERMLSSPPSAPLGLEDDPYDLNGLLYEFTNPRFRQYRQLLDLIDDVYKRVERQIQDLKREPRAS